MLYKPDQAVILLPCPPADLGQGNVLLHKPEIKSCYCCSPDSLKLGFRCLHTEIGCEKPFTNY